MRTSIAKFVKDRGRLGTTLSALAVFLGGLLLLVSGLYFGSLWTLDASEQIKETHLFHDATEAVAFWFLPGLSLLVLAISYGRTRIVAQFLLVFAVLLALASIMFDIFVLIPAAIVGGLTFALYPKRRSLLNISSGPGFRWPIALIAVATAIPLLVNAYRNLDMQFRSVGGEHHELRHWLVTAIMDISIATVILLAATRLPGWRVMSIMGGIGLLVTGVTSLLVPFHAGSWGVNSGIVAIAAGVFYLTIPAWQHAGAERPQSGVHADALAST